MSSKLSKLTLAVLVAAGVAGVNEPTEAKAAVDDFKLTIMHTNDSHANLDNVAKKVTLVKSIRNDNPNNLLLDAGDVFSGTLYFNEFKGQADLEFMNLLQYDAMTFGNHEFDLGESDKGHKALADFVSGAKFPFVSANVDFLKDDLFSELQVNGYTDEFNEGKIYDGIIKEIDGEKIGVFGLTTEETPTISSVGKVEFSNYIRAAEEAVAAFKSAGVNKIVALTHLGYDDSAKFDNDLLLAAAVDGIDVIVGGHSHTELKEPFLYEGSADPVVIVQANEYNKFLGELDLTFDNSGVITDHNGILHNVNDKTITADAEAAALLKPYSERIDFVKNTSIDVEAEVPLAGEREDVRTGETNLGNLIADGMLAAAKKIDKGTVAAVQNGGGIRASINKGDVTMGEVLTTMPFGNALAIMELSGDELKQALEQSVSNFPTASGGFLQVSGLKFTFDPLAAAGSKVKQVQVNINGKFENLKEEQMYKVATNTFTAKGGDDLASFKKAYYDGRVSEPGNIDYEMFIEYLRNLESVRPALESRILALTPFKDITSDWSQPFVSNLYHQKIVKGTSKTSYSPYRSLTRTQAVSLIVRALKLDTNEVVKSGFTDVYTVSPETQKEIDAAFAAGIVKGTDNKFMPYANVTRSQFALMMNRAYDMAKETDYATDKTVPFSDVAKYDAETQKAIAMLYDFGIAEGQNGKFSPGDSANRGQAAKMISNFLITLK